MQSPKDKFNTMSKKVHKLIKLFDGIKHYLIISAAFLSPCNLLYHLPTKNWSHVIFGILSILTYISAIIHYQKLRIGYTYKYVKANAANKGIVEVNQSKKDKFNTLSKKVHKLIKLFDGIKHYLIISAAFILSCILFHLSLAEKDWFCVIFSISSILLHASLSIIKYTPSRIDYTYKYVKANAANKGIVEADQSNLELSNRNSKSLQKSYFEDLPFWAYKLPEDYRANLIDLRKEWYEGKPVNLCTHLRVKLLTLQFLLQDVLGSHISYRWQNVFRPVRRPRL